MIRKRLPKKTKSARSRSKLEAFDESSVIEIERISHDAKGIGFSKGYTVSVPFTIPGEKISIQHAKINDRMVYADIKSIDLQSDNRVEPKCEYFKS